MTRKNYIMCLCVCVCAVLLSTLLYITDYSTINLHYISQSVEHVLRNRKEQAWSAQQFGIIDNNHDSFLFCQL
jgi:hypothetical protein